MSFRQKTLILTFLSLFWLIPSVKAAPLSAQDEIRLKEILRVAAEECKKDPKAPGCANSTQNYTGPYSTTYSEPPYKSPKPESWYKRYWKLEAAAGVLAVLAGFGYGLWRINSNVKKIKK